MSTLSVNEITSQTGNTITVPSGKTFIAPGHIIQAVGVKQGTATAVSQSSNNTWLVTGFGKSITPTSTNSKILIMCSGGMNGAAGGSDGETYGYKIYKSVGGGSYAETESSAWGQSVYYGPGNEYNNLSINYLDSPSTTSAVTYKLYQKRISGSGTASVNRNSNNQTQMIALEVSG